MKRYLVVLCSITLCAVVHAAAPTALSDVGGMSSDQLLTAKEIALGFALLGMGWVGMKAVRQFLKP